MNQPTAPCSPPRTNSRARRGRSLRSIVPRRPEPDQRHDERQSDQPAPQPVGPFQPEDPLEAGEADALVHQGVLRDLLVEVVQPLPFRLAHRRQRAGERRPFHDRKAGAGQAGNAAQHDHHQDHECHGEQPGRDQPAAATASRAVFRRSTGKVADVERHVRIYRRRRRERILRRGILSDGFRGAQPILRRSVGDGVPSPRDHGGGVVS